MKIGNTPPNPPVRPGMLRKTGISPHIRGFTGVLGGYWVVFGGMPR